MMLRHRIAPAFLGLVMTGAAAHAQPRPMAPLPDRLGPAARGTIERLVDSLRAEQLPASALRDKAAEGALKGADDRRIVEAVRSLAGRLRESRAILGDRARDDELIASASALYVGVPADAIARFAAAQRRRDAQSSLTIPLTVVAELASYQVVPDLALRTVESLLSRGARDDEFGAFRQIVDQERRRGVAPPEAAERGLRNVLREIDRRP